MAGSSPIGQKTLWENEKLLFTNIFFSHSDFKRLVLQTLKNKDLFGKGLGVRTLKIVFFLRVISDISVVLSKNKLTSRTRHSESGFP